MTACALNDTMVCHGGRPATMRVVWTIVWVLGPDPVESYLCDRCYKGRPDFVRVLQVERMTAPVTPAGEEGAYDA